MDAYGHGSNAQSTSTLHPTSVAKLVTLCISLSVIVYLSLFNSMGTSPDYGNYVASFNWARDASWSHVFPNRHAWEPGFMLLVFLLTKLIAANSWVFLSIVTLAASIKLGLLYKTCSPIAFVLAMILFFFKYFPLQDYNQLRGAIAISFLLLVYYQWIWKNNLKLTALFSVCAVCFHYSALAVLPFVFLIRHDLFLERLRTLLITFSIFGLLAITGYLTLTYLAPIVPRLSSYGSVAPVTPTYLIPLFFPEVFLIAVSLIFWGDSTQNMKRVIAIQMIGFAIFFGFFDFQVIAIRLREAFSIFWLFYIADYSRTTARLRLATVGFVLMNIALGSYLFYFSNYLK